MKVLTKHDFPEQNTRRTYDWNKILDGKIRELKTGDDFTGEPKAFAARARVVARERGQTVKVDAREKTLVLQAEGTPKTGTPKTD